MRRARRQPVVPIDPEIERTTRRLNREREGTVEPEVIVVEMVENRSLNEFSIPSIDGSRSSITRPTVQANNFEIKSAII